MEIYVTGNTAEELWLRSPDSRESFTADALMNDMLVFLYKGLFVLCCMWWRISKACSSFDRRVRQDNMIFILTCPLSADIPLAMTSLCLSPSGWWESKQHSVSEWRLSHCWDVPMTHPSWHYSGWKSGLQPVMISLIAGGQRKGWKERVQIKKGKTINIIRERSTLWNYEELLYAQLVGIERLI